MDDIFKALSDKSRRVLLDTLRKNDGKTLSELEAVLPNLSRFGVMKHLKILEEALLVTTHKKGRFKYHYLNTVPIQELSDRWISRFAATWAQNITDFKNDIERNTAMSNNKPKHIFTTIIQTDASSLWDALINPKITQQYFFGLSVETDWKEGNDLAYLNSQGEAQIEGKIIDTVPNHKLVYSFSGHCDEEDKEPPSRVTFEIEEMGKACKLTLTHDEFEEGSKEYINVGNGWPTVLSGLKTLLETGKPLIIEAA